MEVLSELIDSPCRPFVAVLGGAKVGEKIGTIASLLRRVDTLLIGGGMCFTFLAAAGQPTGDSLVDVDRIPLAREFLETGKIVVPGDLISARSDQMAVVRETGPTVPEGWKGVDIGSATSSAFSEIIRGAGTVLWNGPMGRFEDPRFAAGTRAVATAVAESPAFTIVGGGDTVAAIDQFHLSDCIDHVSTGGGAMLKFIEYGDLPGLKALRESAAAYMR